LTSLLQQWLTNPNSQHGIRVLDASGTWRHTPYDEVAGLVATTAQVCLDRAPGARVRGDRAERSDGAERSAVIAVCCENPRNFLVGLFGALVTGAHVCCVPPPDVFGSRERYESMLAERVRVLAVDLVLCDGGTEPVLRDLGQLNVPCATVPGRVLDALPAPAVRSGAAIIQFTSGSSAAGKSVVIDLPALEANLGAIADWLGLGPGDGTSSWLPFHHDMGLMGCLLTPLTQQLPIWLMSPQQFVREPITWMRTFAEGATTTAAPPFGYEHCVRRVDDDNDLSLSRWRVAIVGAERIRWQTLRAFAEKFHDSGFAFNAFRPGYGLAEATLAVTGRFPSNPVRAVDVDSESIHHGQPVRFATPDTEPLHRASVLSCGRPLNGCAVEIRSP
jgi:acyl-CoA synthetase (AMP-forming)/AMP-acid ligase II